MRFYNALKLLYLETDVSGISLGAGLLQVREGINCRHYEVPDNASPHTSAFASTRLSSAELGCSSIQQEALGIVHRFEKFHHYCFVITYNKPMAAMVNEEIVMLSWWWQFIMLHILQYSIHILYLPGLELYIVDSLSHHNHAENRDQEMTSMNITYI